MAIFKNTTIDDTGFFGIPSGTIYQRPVSPSTGMFRYNTDFNSEEYYNGTQWVPTNLVPIVTTGLVVYLDAAEFLSYPRTGTVWKDLSGNGNNATLVNGPTFSTDGGGSLVFDGTDDSLSIANSTSLQNTFSTGSFSITSTSKTNNLTYPKSSFPFWLETYVLNAGWAIANRGLSSGDGSNETSFTIEVNNGGTYYANNVPHTVSLSVPYVRTFVFDRSNGFTFRYYVNGVLLGEVGSASITGSIYTSGGFSFGNMWGWMFSGTLYNLLINAKALSSAEALQNYHALRHKVGL